MRFLYPDKKEDNDELDKYQCDNKLQDIFSKYDFSNKKVISFGCGDGRWERLLKSMYPTCEIVGVDNNINVIFNARNESKDITFIHKNFLYLSPQYLSTFDIILWIPGPWLGLYLNSVLAEYWFALKDNMEILMWPCVASSSMFQTDKFMKYLEKNDVNEYTLTKLSYNITKIFSIMEYEDYDNLIKSLTKNICKFDKINEMIRLYDFNCEALDLHIGSQNEFVKTQENLLKVAESKDKIVDFFTNKFYNNK